MKRWGEIDRDGLVVKKRVINALLRKNNLIQVKGTKISRGSKLATGKEGIDSTSHCALDLK